MYNLDSRWVCLWIIRKSWCPFMMRWPRLISVILMGASSVPVLMMMVKSQPYWSSPVSIMKCRFLICLKPYLRPSGRACFTLPCGLGRWRFHFRTNGMVLNAQTPPNRAPGDAKRTHPIILMYLEVVQVHVLGRG